MKDLIKKILQSVLGFRNYLFIFSLYIIYTLKWNKKEGDFLHFLRLLPDEGIILDIGANIGIMTVHAAWKKPRSSVYAFEPIPHNLEALKRIIRFFKLTNVKVFETALGDRDGNISMVMPVIHKVKMQGLSHVINGDADNEEGTRFITPIHKLDSYPELFTSEKTITGIKIDVENYEYYVLDGARRIIEKYRPVVYSELWDTENRYKCFDMMTALGYDVFVLEKDRLVPFRANSHQNQNFFFIIREIHLK